MYELSTHACLCAHCSEHTCDGSYERGTASKKRWLMPAGLLGSWAAGNAWGACTGNLLCGRLKPFWCACGALAPLSNDCRAEAWGSSENNEQVQVAVNVVGMHVAGMHARGRRGTRAAGRGAWCFVQNGAADVVFCYFAVAACMQCHVQ